MLAPYRQPERWRALFQLLNTAIPFVAVWTLMYWSLSVSYWLTLALAVPAALLLATGAATAQDYPVKPIRLIVPFGADQAALQSSALADPKVQPFIEGKQVVKVIVAGGKLVSVVVK